MSMKLAFEIELHSDYHVGAGHGLGPLIDSALQRDMDGVPVLRGTTVTGLLRDGLYRLLQLQPFQGKHRGCQASGLAKKDAQGHDTPRFCGQHDPNQTDCPICRIFGSPRAARRWRIESARPADLPSPLKTKEGWQDGEAGTQVAPHVRINPRTRRAEAKKLFFREEGDARLRFKFTATCEVEDDKTLAEAAWLVAAARCVRHLGASRRRGRGECLISLKDVEIGEAIKAQLPADQSWQQWLLDRFEEWHLKGNGNYPTFPLLEFLPSTVVSNGHPVRMLLVARLDEPLIVSEKAEAGNEYQTLDYVPGSALRGAFAGRAAAMYRLKKNTSEAYDAFVRLFFRDGARFSPLYPAYHQDSVIYPSIPAPRDLLSCELYPGFAISDISPSHDAAGFALKTETEDVAPDCPRCKQVDPEAENAMKPFGGFLSLQYPPKKVEIQKLTEMHVHIDPETHRAASPDLFSFNMVAPGQYFVGEIACIDAAARDDFCQLCSIADAFQAKGLTLHLGKANRRGYGKVTIWLLEQQETEHPWYQLPFDHRVPDPTAPLVLTLLTDAILPDRWDRFRTTLDEAWLTGMIKEQLPDTKVEVKRSFCANRAVDSYNAYLGLPRWRDVALCAGSTVGFQVSGESLSAEEKQTLLKRLEEIERQGVGLRRGEGFGQVVFNHPIYSKCEALEDAAGIKLEGDGHKMGLAIGGKDHTLAIEDAFRQDWEIRLTEERKQYQDKNKPDPFAHKAFEALARLLRSVAPSSKEGVDALVSRLGQPAELLPETTRQSLRVREEEKASLNFFRTEKAKPGLKTLAELVEALGQETHNRVERLTGAAKAETQRRCWRIGLELLVDRIAAVSGKEER